MSKLTCTHNGITVKLNRDEGRIDSRIIAEALGIKHKHFLETLERHQNDLNACGVFRFETAKPQKGTTGGRPEKFAMLNEDQFIFAVTLSRNTPRVVQAKLAVVKAFSEARRLLAEQNTAYLPAFHILHNTAEKMESVAQARGSSAPRGACHIWLERHNNKLLGIDSGQRDNLTTAQKSILVTLCRIEEATVNQVLADGGNEKEAYHAAKDEAVAFMRQYGTNLMEART